MAKKKNPEIKIVRRKTGLPSGAKIAIGGIVGGAVGALSGALLSRGGVSPKTAAMGLTAAGAVGALVTNGATRAAAAGVAAAGAGQMAMAWLAAQAMQQPAEAPAPASAVARQAALSDDEVRRAFADVRREIDPVIDEDVYVYPGN